jgi:hypothetical protein
MQRWVSTSLVHLREETFKCLGSYVTKNNALPMMKYEIKLFAFSARITLLHGPTRLGWGDWTGKARKPRVALPDWRHVAAHLAANVQTNVAGVRCNSSNALPCAPAIAFRTLDGCPECWIELILQGVYLRWQVGVSIRVGSTAMKRSMCSINCAALALGDCTPNSSPLCPAICRKPLNTA